MCGFFKNIIITNEHFLILYNFAFMQITLVHIGAMVWGLVPEPPPPLVRTQYLHVHLKQL